MRIQVSQISEKDGLRRDYRFPEGKPDLVDPDCSVAGESSLGLFAERSGSEVKLSGTLHAKIQFNCDRCLESVVRAVDEEFDLFYIPSFQKGSLNDEAELTEEDLTVSFYEDDLINVGDIMREQIELVLPMSKVCDDDCRGLCSECGVNLNKIQCSCRTAAVDPRLAALRDLGLRDDPR